MTSLRLLLKTHNTGEIRTIYYEISATIGPLKIERRPWANAEYRALGAGLGLCAV